MKNTKKLLMLLGNIIGIVVVTGFVTIPFFPGTMVSPMLAFAESSIEKEIMAMQASAANSSGLTKKNINIKGYIAHYYEGGARNSDVLVLLHGLVDDKNTFVPAVSELTKTHRVILPDLQAHGENAQIKGRDHSIEGQAAFIRDLLETLSINSLYIGGNSMGGHTAAAFTYRYQQMVKGLIILNATGVWVDKKSTYFHFPEKIDDSFMKHMWANFLINPPKLPDSVWSYMAANFEPKIPFFNGLVDEVQNSIDFRLDEKLETVKVPALVLWGNKDKIVPVFHGEAYHSKLKNSELKILNAGHGPQLDIPEIVQQEISRFIKEN